MEGQEELDVLVGATVCPFFVLVEATFVTLAFYILINYL